MAITIKTIPNGSEAVETTINDNFNALKKGIDNGNLQLKYLDLYSLVGSAETLLTNVQLKYAQLNLNEGLVIVKGEDKNPSVIFQGVTYNVGDYLIRAVSGPLRIEGPTIGAYKPVLDGTNLSWEYQAIPDTLPVGPSVSLTGNNGSGYTYTFSFIASATTSFNVPCVSGDPTPVLFFYTDEGYGNEPVAVPGGVYTITKTGTNFIIAPVSVWGFPGTLTVR